MLSVTGLRRLASSGLDARWCTRMRYLLVALVILWGGMLSRIEAQTPLTTNLLVNPGAESGSIENWTASGPGSPTVDTGTFDPGINPHTGGYDFLGRSGASDSLSQTVSPLTQGVTAAMLDSGNVMASLSFWEQGFSQATPSDDASVTLTFTDGSGTSLGTVTSGEVDSHGGTWVNFTGSYPLPIGTRSITYTMNFILHAGTDLDAFVDDNSLLLTTAAGLRISANSLTFANQPVGTLSPAQVVTVTNPGSATVNFSGIAVALGANPLEFAETNNCPAALASGASCQISVTFAPHGVGTKSAGLEIGNDSVVPQPQVMLTGTGTGGVLRVDPGSLKTIAGDGAMGYAGDGGLATSAGLGIPDGIGFDPAGNLYIADSGNNVVRKVDTQGVITTFAGNGAKGYTGDGGQAVNAELDLPLGVTSDAAGNIYVLDSGNNVIRKVNAAGVITTFAGTGTAGHAGDGGPATAARFNLPQGARFDKAGNLLVAQCGGASVRRIDINGIITTVAGNFTSGFLGDGGQATSAELNCPSAAAADAAGNLYIADYFNQRIRKVDPTGVITTIAGDGNASFSGDGGPATAAELNLPNDVVVDAAGNIYIADSGNNRIRKIDTSGIMTTVAGGLQNAGSPGVNTPLALTFDAAGNLYYSDAGSNTVQEFFPVGTAPFQGTPLGTTAATQTVTLSNIGNLPITIASGTSFSLSGNPSDFAVSGGTCLAGATIESDGGSCTLQISFTPTVAGLRTLVVSVVDSALNSPQTFSINGTGLPVPATLTWAQPAPIVFGTALSGAQLDAVATGVTGAAVAGSFAYTPAAGTVVGVGSDALGVVFTPSDPSYLSVRGGATITVTQATPAVVWAVPASIAYGIPLGAAQLDATAVGVGGVALAGTFTYSPVAGTVLTPGTQALQVTFVPTDATDYMGVSGSVGVTVTGVAVGSIAPNTGTVGDGDKTITLTGSGFVTTSVAQVNGVTVATAYVNPTTLTAVVPAANFATPGTLQMTVSDPTISARSTAVMLTVSAPVPAVALTGPSTAVPGSQPSVGLTIANPYPVDLTVTFTLSFAAASSGVDDPSIQFAAGGRTYSFVVPAHSVSAPPVQLQAGTDAGTITIPAMLTAYGQNVTPTTLTPLVIVVPAALPVVSTVMVTRAAGQVTVAIHGFSNTREVSQATFHFAAAAGATLSTPDVTAPVGTLFTGWYGAAQSLPYGSTFTYTQVFDVSGAATDVGSVQVTLTNSVGASVPQTAQ